MKRIVATVVFVLFSTRAYPGSFPKNWVLTCDNRTNYVVSDDRAEFVEGEHSATLQSVDSEKKGCGALGQIASAADYHGKRLRLTAFVKSDAVSGWAGLWLRGDREDGAIVAFDNMQDRAIRGTNEWQQYQVVLDIPDDARSLAYGALIDGAGKIWLDDVVLQVVDQNVAVTKVAPVAHPKAPMNEAAVKAAPANLGMEEWTVQLENPAATLPP